MKAADVAVQALETVATAVEVGVGMGEYRTRITDAKVVVDRFLNTWPVDLKPSLRATIDQAMSEFVESVRLWQDARALRQESLSEVSLPKRGQLLEQALTLMRQVESLQNHGVATTKSARSLLTRP